MNCDEAEILLHGLLDDEIDAEHADRVETHMGACACCAAQLRLHRAMRAMMSSANLRFPAPATLRTRIRAMPPVAAAGAPYRLRTLFKGFAFGSALSAVAAALLMPTPYRTTLTMTNGSKKLMNRQPSTAIGQPNEIVGVLMPNAAATLGLILGLTVAKRVPAMLNYTAGPEGIRAACVAAGIHRIVASRVFIEKARLTALIDALSGIEFIYVEDLKARVSMGWRKLQSVG